MDMSLVFLEFSVDQNIIQIYKNESVQKVSKNIILKGLEDLGHWLAQKHYQISKMSKWCIECSLPSFLCLMRIKLYVLQRLILAP